METLIYLLAAAGGATILGLAIYGAYRLVFDLTPSQVEGGHKTLTSPQIGEPIVETKDGKRYRLVGKAGEHASGVRVGGMGFMLISEHSVKPEYVQTIKDYLTA